MRITFPSRQPNLIRVEFSPATLRKYQDQGLSLIATLNSAGQVDWLHLETQAIHSGQSVVANLDAFQPGPDGLAAFEFSAPASPGFREEKESRASVAFYLEIDAQVHGHEPGLNPDFPPAVVSV